MNSDDEEFISLTADSTFKRFFKGEFKWFYRDIIYDYTGIDINDYYFMDNELNSGKKKNKNDIRYDMVLMKKDHSVAIDIEMNQYNCLHRNEMYLHSLNSWLYKKHRDKLAKNADKKNIVMPLLKQVNFNVFDTSDEINTHIALRNRNGKVIIDNFQIFDINLYINDKLMYNKDKRLQLLACESFEDMEEVIGGEEKYMSILKALKRLSRDDNFLEEYNKETDMVFMMNEVEGHGREEGRSEGIKETAKKMLKKNYNISDISDVTGLSETAISALM